jgi:hypothetical protein
MPSSKNCYHLKDWLKNDPTTQPVVGDVEQVITASTYLSLCADLANGSKHLTLTRSRADPTTRIGRRRFALNLGGGPPSSQCVVFLSSGQPTPGP